MAEPIVPIWKKQDPDTGEWIFGLTPGDMARVEAGYACFRCLEPFEFWLAKCPVCGQSQQKTRTAIVATPEGW